MDVLLLEELLELRAEVAKYRRLDAAHTGPSGAHAAKRHLAAIVESSNDAIISADLEGRVLTLNAGAERMFGYRAEEVVGRDVTTLRSVTETPSIADVLQRIRNGERVHFADTQRLHKDGTPLAVSANISPIRDSTGAVVGASAIIRDIAQQKAVQLRLEQSEARYRSVIAAMAEGVCIFDPQGNVFTANPAAEKIFGRTADNLCRHTAESPVHAIHEDGSPFLRETFPVAVTIRTGQPQANVVMGIYRTSDGQLIWVSINTQPLRAAGRSELLGVVATFNDITERKAAEQRFKASERRLAEAQRVAAVGHYEADLRTRMISWSTSLYQILGIDPSVNPLPMAQLRTRIHPEDTSLLDQVMRDSQADGMPRSQRIRIVRPDGEVRHMLAHGHMHFDEQGVAVAVVGTLQDITPLAQAERALHETNGQLERRVQERTRELTQANNELKREIEQRRAVEEELRNEQRLLEQLLMAHERDRQLTAYEVHDGFVQDAVGAKMHLEAFQRRLAALPNAPAAELDASIKLLGHAVAEGRRLITGLRPPIIDEAGVVAAIEYLVREHQVPGALEIEFEHQTQFDRLTPILEGSIYRIVQETLTNVARHSHTEKALVRLVQEGNRLRLEIRDWGVGFDPGSISETRYGLQGIRERARLLRGKAMIGSRPGEGTCIVVDLPVVLPT